MASIQTAHTNWYSQITDHSSGVEKIHELLHPAPRCGAKTEKEMKVKTPCFVHVKDETKFNDLVEWVRQLNMMYWCRHESGIVCVGNDRLFALNGFRVGFDCGENIELFKALAAMNDKNDREQWFVVEHTGNADEIVLANSEDALAYIQSGDGYRKTTAAEIIEHFKNKGT